MDSERFYVEGALIKDVLAHEGGEVLLCDETAAVVRTSGWTKCLFKSPDLFEPYCKKLGVTGRVSVLGVPLDFASSRGLKAKACKTLVYLRSMPPLPDLPRGVEIKRLAHTLAPTVADIYRRNGGSYTDEEMDEVMRNKGVFGAISGGALAGFIGRHADGAMGMLEVDPAFRRKGIGECLEKFIIGYVMTCGRTPFCDVVLGNDASFALQEKLGLTPSEFYTFWIDEF